jgi:tRNA(Ile)-lysidine synthetase-like protein
VELRLRVAEGTNPDAAVARAVLRGPRAGDRVRLRHSRGAKPLKEIFERMNIDAAARRAWPVLEWTGRIVWMKDVAVDAGPEIPFAIEVVRGDESDP